MLQKNRMKIISVSVRTKAERLKFDSKRPNFDKRNGEVLLTPSVSQIAPQATVSFAVIKKVNLKHPATSNSSSTVKLSRNSNSRSHNR